MDYVIKLPCAIAALSAFFLCDNAFAQAEQTREGLNSPYYVKTGDILGAKVYWSTNAADQSKPAIGEVKDLIVDTGRGLGHGVFAVLSDGEVFTIGRDPLHGVACLRWDEGTKKFTIDDSAPTLRDTADAAADRDKKAVAAARPDLEPRMRTPSRLLMYSGVKGVKVLPQGSQDSFGKLDELWVDVRRGCVGFLTVSSGGVLGVGDTTRLVPWQAASVEKSVDRKENQIHVRASKEALEASPKVEAKTDINEPNLRATACKHFNCDESGSGNPAKDRTPANLEKEKMKEEGKR
jgi:hypothetical protein